MLRAKFSEVSRVSETRLGQSSKLGVGIQGEVLYYTALSQKAPGDSGEMITDIHTLLVTRHTCAVLISCQCSPCDLDLGGVPLKTVISSPLEYTGYVATMNIICLPAVLQIVLVCDRDQLRLVSHKSYLASDFRSDLYDSSEKSNCFCKRKIHQLAEPQYYQTQNCMTWPLQPPFLSRLSIV